MLLSVVARYVALSWRIFLVNLQTALSFKSSFILHIIGIMIFYSGQFFIWTVFFKQFPLVGGWTYNDVMLVYSLYTFSMSLMDVFAGGITDLAQLINAGGLDYFITFPKPVLWHLAVSKSDVVSLGTIALSLGFFFCSGPLFFTRILLFFLAAIFCMVVLFNFLVITQSLAFFISGFDRGASTIRYQLAIVSPYPFAIFPAPFKYLLMTVIPSFFIVTLPAQLVDHFTFTTLAILVAASIASSVMAYNVFRIGLKRYESGNLISTRM